MRWLVVPQLCARVQQFDDAVDMEEWEKLTPEEQETEITLELSGRTLVRLVPKKIMAVRRAATATAAGAPTAALGGGGAAAAAATGTLRARIVSYVRCASMLRCLSVDL